MAHAVRSPGGSKDAFWADITPYESGSDHWIYQEGAFAIPSIYLRDHPDVYIHTTGDVPDHIEPTKIKRSAFVAAASGYYLATMPDGGAALMRLAQANGYARLAEDGRRAAVLAAGGRTAEAANLVTQGLRREESRLTSISRFAVGKDAPPLDAGTLERMRAGLGAAARAMLDAMPGLGGPASAEHPPATDARVPVRDLRVKGPLGPGDDWLAEKAGSGAAIAITRVPRSEDVTYEIVNFVDGTRTVADIRDAVSAEFAPVDLGAVSEYLDLLARAGAITFRR
jgi:hypothetical protein